MKTLELVRTGEVLAGGHVKAGMIKAHLQWLRERGGPAAVTRVVERLPLQVWREMESALASTWCTFESLVLLDRAIEEACGHVTADVPRELGAYSARLNLTTTYRLFKRENIHELFRRSAPLHTQFQDFGSVEYGHLAEKHVQMRHARSACFSPIYCRSAIGYYEEAIAIHGGTRIAVDETACQCAGDEGCTFDLTWH